MKPTYLSILMIWAIMLNAQNPLLQDFDFSNIKPYVAPKEEVKSSPDVSKSNSTKTEKVNSSASATLVCHAYDYCMKCLGDGKIGMAPRIRVVCSQCKGIDNNVLYLKPCTKCKNTRTVEIADPNYSFPDCKDCSGRGYNKGHSFQVAEYDAGKQVSYFEALKICESKGDGWRLPKENELKGMDRFLHRKGLGNFSGSYWGYTPYDPYGTDANVYNFNSGFGSSNFFEAPNNLRLVRTLP